MRKDDYKMILLRIVSAISLVFFIYQLAKEPSNIDDIASFTNENINDLFNWGNDRFVLGQLPSSAGSGGLKKKKSPQEIFMEAILDPESLDEEQKAEAEAKENEAEKKGGIPTLDDLLRDTEDEENS